jgi:hypothetical protein
VNIDMQGNRQREFRFVIDRLFMTVMHGLAQGYIGYWQAVNTILGREIKAVQEFAGFRCRSNT